jgi:hypothetical protein
LLKFGLNAGSRYGEVRIRDFNTLLKLSFAVNPSAELRSALPASFKFHAANGDSPGGYIPKAKAGVLGAAIPALLGWAKANREAL